MEFLDSARLIKNNFAQELFDASAGKKTSLRFIKHQLPSKKIVNENELFQVIVIGGSVFQKALLKKDGGSITITESSSQEHPLLNSKEELLSFLSKQLYPEINVLAINFAFQLAPVFNAGVPDGMLVAGSKENQLNGLIGLQVGSMIKQYIRKYLKRDISIALANDVICLLLSGEDNYPYEKTVGAIMGTGTNIAFFDSDNAINLESGNFRGFNPTDAALVIDNSSDQPGTALFEKETAGAYLYRHFNLFLKEHNINCPQLNSTKELADIAQGNFRELSLTLSSKEREYVRQIATSLFEKSAAYFAGQIAGLADFKQSEINVVMEGSMYWKNPLYQQYFKNYLDKLSANYKITIVKIENSSIIGAAKLIA